MNQRQRPLNGLEYGGSLEEYGQRRNRLVKEARPHFDSPARMPGCQMYQRDQLDFFDLNDGFAFIGAAVQTGVVRELQFVALRADRHTRRCYPQFLSATLVASRP